MCRFPTLRGSSFPSARHSLTGGAATRRVVGVITLRFSLPFACETELPVSNKILTLTLFMSMKEVDRAGKVVTLKHAKNTAQKLMIAVGRIDEPTRFFLRSFPKSHLPPDYVGCSWLGLPFDHPFLVVWDRGQVQPRFEISNGQGE